jgi:hypothetical protein
MKFVPRPDAYPGHSALDPGRKAGSDCKWIDTGRTLGGCRVYLTDSDARQLGAMVGLVHPQEVRRVQAEADAHAERVQRLEKELLEERRRWDALDVLESEGFRARKKPGRPAREAVG